MILPSWRFLLLSLSIGGLRILLHSLLSSHSRLLRLGTGFSQQSELSRRHERKQVWPSHPSLLLPLNLLGALVPIPYDIESRI